MARTSTEPDHFTYTAGNVMTLRDSNGIPSLNVNTEYFVGYMETPYNLYYNNEGVWVTDDENLMRTRFAEDGTLFLINRFVSCNYLRDMKNRVWNYSLPQILGRSKRIRSACSRQRRCVLHTGHHSDFRRSDRDARGALRAKLPHGYSRILRHGAESEIYARQHGCHYYRHD